MKPFSIIQSLIKKINNLKITKEEALVGWKHLGSNLLTINLVLSGLYMAIILSSATSVCGTSEYFEYKYQQNDSDRAYYRWNNYRDEWQNNHGLVCQDYIEVRTNHYSSEGLFPSAFQDFFLKLPYLLVLTSIYLMFYLLMVIYARRYEIREAKLTRREHSDYVMRFLHMDYVDVEDILNIAVVFRIVIILLLFSGVLSL